MPRRTATAPAAALDDWSDDDTIPDHLLDEPALWPDSALQALFAETAGSRNLWPADYSDYTQADYELDQREEQ